MTFQFDYIRRSDFQAAARRLEVSVPVIKAVAAVEGRNAGFLKGTDLPIILFEGHHFHRLTGGIHHRAAPSISYPKWVRSHYKGGKGEYQRLKTAVELNGDNPDPALKSASWGMFQIMGFNHELAGYDDVRDFVDWMSMGEGYHLQAFVSFIQKTGLAPKLQSGDWADFARGYNGPAFAKNKYDTKIAQQFRIHSMKAQEEAAGETLAVERGDAVELQAALNLAIGAGLATDGWIGQKTIETVRRFQEANGMEPDGVISPALFEALGIDHAPYTETEAGQ